VGAEGGVEFDRAEAGVGGKAGLHLELDRDRPVVRVCRLPDPDVVQAVLEVLVGGLFNTRNKSRTSSACLNRRRPDYSKE
jgi:hypothetical protein